MRISTPVFIVLFGLAGCGSDSQGGSSSNPPPVPPPVVNPPGPQPIYVRYVDLTGNQNFRTACASLNLSATPPVARPATGFGDGLSLVYTATSDSYALSGDGTTATFGPADIDPAAPAGVRGYAKTVDGFMQRFSIGQPTASGTGLDYARGFGLTVRNAGTVIQYQCVFGVATVTTDAPAGSNIAYSRVGVNGSAYVVEGGVQRVYSLRTSTATFAADQTNGRVTITLQLVGVLQTASGPSGGDVPLGSYTGTGSIDSSWGSFSGQLTGPAGETVNASFGGWYFGPQGIEAAFSLSLASDTNGGARRLAVNANVAAVR